MSNMVEKMPVYCPQCNKKLLVPVSAAGKQGRCPACTATFLLEAPYAASVVDPHPQLQPLAAGDLQPIGNSSFGPPDEYSLAPPPSAPAGASPFGTAMGGKPQREAAFQVPNPYAPAPADAKPVKYGHGLGWEHRGWDAGMLGGLLMMVIALVWFFGGLWLGVLFYYPPILFIIGLVGFFRGLFTGNVSG